MTIQHFIVSLKGSGRISPKQIVCANLRQRFWRKVNNYDNNPEDHFINMAEVKEMAPAASDVQAAYMLKRFNTDSDGKTSISGRYGRNNQIILGELRIQSNQLDVEIG